MKLTLLTETNIKDTIVKYFRENRLNTNIIDIEKENLIHFKPTNLNILLTKNILSRKQNIYKKIVIHVVNNNNIKMIEVAFEKSNIDKEKSYSSAIIYGFGSMTLDLVYKIIKSYNNKIHDTF